MTTTLRQGPNGPFIEIDPQMLEEAGFRAEASVELRREGDRIVISSAGSAVEADPDREARFQEAMKWTFERYDETFRKLSE